jgi:hypothetical protein
MQVVRISRGGVRQHRMECCTTVPAVVSYHTYTQRVRWQDAWFGTALVLVPSSLQCGDW